MNEDQLFLIVMGILIPFIIRTRWVGCERDSLGECYKNSWSRFTIETFFYRDFYFWMLNFEGPVHDAFIRLHFLVMRAVETFVFLLLCALVAYFPSILWLGFFAVVWYVYQLIQEYRKK